MILYDVFSQKKLIRLKEIIDRAINPIFDQYPDLKITRQELKKLFQVEILEHIYFLMAVIMIRLMKMQLALLWVLS